MPGAAEEDEIEETKAEEEVIEAAIVTNSATPVVKLALGDERFVEFKDIDEFADWLNALNVLMQGHKADLAFAAFEGLKRHIADRMVEYLRDELRAKAGDRAADAFPDDAIFRGQWLIDFRMSQDDPSKLQFLLESHVKALIVTLSGCIAEGHDETTY